VIFVRATCPGSLELTVNCMTPTVPFMMSMVTGTVTVPVEANVKGDNPSVAVPAAAMKAAGVPVP
jgi:hypothetical protein